MPNQLRQVREQVSRALDGGGPYAPQELPRDVDIPSGTALVVHTSGSTGTPRAVALSADALRASARATHERLGGPGRWFLTLPATHVAGLQVISRSIVAGTAVGGGDPGPFRPDSFAEAASRFLSGDDRPAERASRESEDGDGRGGTLTGGTPTGGSARAYVSLVPTQAHRLIEAAAGGAPAGLAALARFDGVLLGGAATAPTVLAHLRDAGVRAVTTYGMSETCGGCVYDGVPLPGVRARLVDATTGQPTMDDGIIELAGPTLATGYLGNDDATAAVFRTDADGARWFRTSDLGRFDAEGRLHILGRADDVIVTGGVNVAPTAIEEALADLGEVCVVGVPDEEWGQAVVAVLASSDVLVDGHGAPEGGVATIPLRAAPPDLTQRIREVTAARVNRSAVPRRVYLTADLPLRGPGKPDRSTVGASVRRAEGSDVEP